MLSSNVEEWFVSRIGLLISVLKDALDSKLLKVLFDTDTQLLCKQVLIL